MNPTLSQGTLTKILLLLALSHSALTLITKNTPLNGNISKSKPRLGLLSRKSDETTLTQLEDIHKLTGLTELARK